MSMRWTGSTKWTIIAHTVGSYVKLKEPDVDVLVGLGFACPQKPENSFDSEARHEEDLSNEEIHASDDKVEWQIRYWTRRLLDEEKQLKRTVPTELAEEFHGCE